MNQIRLSQDRGASFRRGTSSSIAYFLFECPSTSCSIGSAPANERRSADGAFWRRHGLSSPAIAVPTGSAMIQLLLPAAACCSAWQRLCPKKHRLPDPMGSLGPPQKMKGGPSSLLSWPLFSAIDGGSARRSACCLSPGCRDWPLAWLFMTRPCRRRLGRRVLLLLDGTGRRRKVA